jgi:hypothetical protein
LHNPVLLKKLCGFGMQFAKYLFDELFRQENDR